MILPSAALIVEAGFFRDDGIKRRVQYREEGVTPSTIWTDQLDTDGKPTPSTFDPWIMLPPRLSSDA